MTTDGSQGEDEAPSSTPDCTTVDVRGAPSPSADVEGSEDVEERPSDQDEEDCDSLPTGVRWHVAAASRAGRAHVEADVPCQDSSAYLVCGDTDTLIAAVADGAGSAAHSELGAHAAATTFISCARTLLAEGNSLLQALEAAFDAARRAVSDLAKDPADVSDYATTLLTVIWTDEGLLAAQVGDGMIVADGEGVIDPDSGEYANETRFITSTDASPSVRLIDAAVVRLAMMTDGLQSIALDYGGGRPTPHAPFFDPLFQWLSEQDDEEQACARLGSFLESDRVRERTHDDLTLLLALRSPFSSERGKPVST